MELKEALNTVKSQSHQIGSGIFTSIDSTMMNVIDVYYDRRLDGDTNRINFLMRTMSEDVIISLEKVLSELNDMTTSLHRMKPISKDEIIDDDMNEYMMKSYLTSISETFIREFLLSRVSTDINSILKDPNKDDYTIGTIIREWGTLKTIIRIVFDSIITGFDPERLNDDDVLVEICNETMEYIGNHISDIFKS